MPLLGIFLSVAAIGLILAAMIHPDAAHRFLDSIRDQQPSSLVEPVAPEPARPSLSAGPPDSAPTPSPTSSRESTRRSTTSTVTCYVDP